MPLLSLWGEFQSPDFNETVLPFDYALYLAEQTLVGRMKKSVERKKVDIANKIAQLQDQIQALQRQREEIRFDKNTGKPLDAKGIKKAQAEYDKRIEISESEIARGRKEIISSDKRIVSLSKSFGKMKDAIEKFTSETNRPELTERQGMKAQASALHEMDQLNKTEMARSTDFFTRSGDKMPILYSLADQEKEISLAILGAESQYRGTDLAYDLEISMEQSRNGFVTEVEFARMEHCTACYGLGMILQPLSNCYYCNGSGQVESNVRLGVKVPAGIENKTPLRFRGEGYAGMKGGPPGDLYVICSILP